MAVKYGYGTQAYRDCFDRLPSRTCGSRFVTSGAAIYGGAFGMVFVLAAYFFGAELLSTLVGKEYVAAAAVLSLMLLAATIDLAAQSLRSAAYAIGHAGKVLRMYAISAVAYVISFIGLTTWLGLIGAGLAACIAASIPIFAMVVLIRQFQFRCSGKPELRLHSMWNF